MQGIELSKRYLAALGLVALLVALPAVQAPNAGVRCHGPENACSEAVVTSCFGGAVQAAGRSDAPIDWAVHWYHRVAGRTWDGDLRVWDDATSFRYHDTTPTVIGTPAKLALTIYVRPADSTSSLDWRAVNGAGEGCR